MIGARQVPALARRTLRGWIDDGAPDMGAALAFYTLLTLAPLLMVAVGLAGFFLGREEAHGAFIAQAAAWLGDGAAFGLETALDAAGSREAGLTPALVGAVAMFIGAITIFAELKSGLRRIWKAPEREPGGPVRQIAVGASLFMLVAAVGLLLAASLAASAFLAAVRPGALDAAPVTLRGIEFLASLVGVTVLFAVLYKAVPGARIAWGDVWLGAAFASFLFWLGKLGFALYFGAAALDSSFGAAGLVVMVALWAYFSAQAFFLGAELTRHYALAHGSRRHEAAAPTLAEMNAAFEELVERSRRRGAGRLLGSDSG